MRFDTPSGIVREPLVRALLLMLLFIAGLTLAQMLWTVVIQFGDILVLFALAWIISFLLEPMVSALERLHWVPRPLAILVVYAGLLLVAATSITLLVPLLASQSQMAASRFPDLDQSVRDRITALTATLESRGVSAGDYSAQLIKPLESVGPWLVSNAVAFATATASILAQVVLALVLSLYFVIDGERLRGQFISAFPGRYRDDIAYFVASTNRAFGGFLRGQVLQSLIYALGIAVIMLGTGLPFAALTSVLAGVSIFIPFIGPVLATAVPTIIALTTDAGRAWLVAVLAILLNLVVVNVIAPKLMSQQIGLSPVMVLAAVIIGARLGGPWGAIFGVPIAAVISTMIAFYQLTRAERERHVVEIGGQPESESAAQEASLEPLTATAGPP
ncbi:MAG: AI-2E family transporter [Chloroflexi bacterium]|nr:AI-2E family transporter [Chloroflexota bacterium]